MMSVVVVQRFEVIDVDHQERELIASAVGTFYFEIKLLLEVSPSTETSQIVSKRKAQQSFICLFARQQVFGYQRQRPKQLCVFLAEVTGLLIEQLQGSQHSSLNKER